MTLGGCNDVYYLKEGICGWINDFDEKEYAEVLSDADDIVPCYSSVDHLNMMVTGGTETLVAAMQYGIDAYVSIDKWC